MRKIEEWMGVTFKDVFSFYIPCPLQINLRLSIIELDLHDQAQQEQHQVANEIHP